MTISAHATAATSIARQVLDRIEDAWNAGDGAGFGAAYAPDASFVTVRGQHLVGRATIAAGHDGIFRTVYAGSTNQMRLVSAHDVAPGVVLAVSVHTLDVPGGPLAGRHQASSTSLLTREGDGSWLVAATHNTLVAA